MHEEPFVKWDADPNAFYTLLMTDPDAHMPDSDKSRNHEWLHWLIVNIPGNAVEQGTKIA